MKVAFASKDGKNVNEHFGWCENFYIYEIDKSSFSFLEKIDSSKKYDEEVDKLTYKIECVSGCDIVYVTQIGPKAANMVKLAGIYPMKSSKEDESIAHVIEAMQRLMRNPPLWMQRIVLK